MTSTTKSGTPIAATVTTYDQADGPRRSITYSIRWTDPERARTDLMVSRPSYGRDLFAYAADIIGEDLDGHGWWSSTDAKHLGRKTCKRYTARQLREFAHETLIRYMLDETYEPGKIIPAWTFAA